MVGEGRSLRTRDEDAVNEEWPWQEEIVDDQHLSLSASEDGDDPKQEARRADLQL